jgi:signal peptidase I
MPNTPHPKPVLHNRAGGILSLSGPALLDLLRAVLDKRVPFRFTARGFSMSPFIKDGDVVTVSPCAPRAIRYGDVVAFVNPCHERLAVHRVVGISQDARLIKGDNTPEEDGWIPPARILGRVTRVERDGKRVRLGLGIERVVIAFLARRGWLAPVMWSVWRVVRPVFKTRKIFGGLNGRRN